MMSVEVEEKSNTVLTWLKNCPVITCYVYASEPKILSFKLVIVQERVEWGIAKNL